MAGTLRSDPQHTARLRAAVRLTLDTALSEIVDALAQDGVRPLLLKGPSFADWLYDDPSERTYCDVDLLVAPEQLEEARRSLARRGFQQVAEGIHPHEQGHHETWVRRTAPAATVELHHTVFLLDAPPALVWRRFAEGAEIIIVDGVEVPIPGPAARALTVVLHAVHHGVGFRKPLRDLDHAIDRVDLGTWRRAATLARELGGEAAFAAGLRLAPGGDALVGELGLAAFPASRYLRLRASTPPVSAVGIEHLVLARGVEAKLKVLVRTIVPSPGFMRARYGLARRGRAGLMFAYLSRPVRIAVKLPWGIRAWFKAVRSVSARGAN